MSRLLPEWAPQACVLLTWPRPDGDFAPWLNAVEDCYCEIIRCIGAGQSVVVVCHDLALRNRAHRRLRQIGVSADRLRFSVIPNNDVWIRDYGPLSIGANGETQLVDFRFNGWGGKYPADRDDRVTAQLQDQGLLGDVMLHRSGVTLEGGAVETDGQGTLLARDLCLFDTRRNPESEKAALEAALRDVLGLTAWQILRHGELEGDDTDAHIDTLARFADERTILFQGCDDTTDSHHPSLMAMTGELQGLRSPQGDPWRLVPLPWPTPVRDGAGLRKPASYANFLITNHCVLVPTYGCASDSQAVRIIADCFPGRQTVGIDCRALVMQHGSLHCATMQVHA